MDGEQTITLSNDDFFSLLDLLRLTPIYALLGSEDQAELGEDFKPWKWTGYEKDHAEESARLYKVVLDAAQKESNDQSDEAPQA